MSKHFDHDKIDVNKLSDISEGLKDSPKTDVNTIKVKTLSKGKLNIPEELTIRNFKNKDILNMTVAEESDYLKEAVQLIQGAIIDEGIDAFELTTQDLQHLLLVIYSNFWGSTITFPYELEEDEVAHLKEKNERIYKAYKDGKQTFTVEVPISKFNINFLDEGFKHEPIKATFNNIEVHFILPRLKHVIVAQDYALKILDDQGRGKLLRKLNDEDISFVERKEAHDAYKEFSSYVAQLLKVQVVQYFKNSSVEYENPTLADQVKIDDEDLIPAEVWLKYNNYVENLSYGIDTNVTVKSPVTSKVVERRFQFRFDQIISQLKLPEDSGVNISFD